MRRKICLVSFIALILLTADILHRLLSGIDMISNEQAIAITLVSLTLMIPLIVFFEDIYLRFEYLIDPCHEIDDRYLLIFEDKIRSYLPRASSSGHYNVKLGEKILVQNCYSSPYRKYCAVEFNKSYNLMLQLLHDMENNNNFTVRDFKQKIKEIDGVNDKIETLYAIKAKEYKKNKDECVDSLERIKSFIKSKML